MTERTIRLVLAGGGTGGHVQPAVAVVEELRARNVGLDLLWIGSMDGIERAAADAMGARYAPIATGKFRRYLDLKTFVDTGRVPAGILQARRLLTTFRPDLVFSTGGFVSVPTVIASRGIAPVLTHEQTTVIGLATRINLRFSDVLALTFASTQSRLKGFRGRVVVTGNPVRPSLLAGDATRARAAYGLSDELPVLLVTGGARGASPINERVAALLPELLETAQVIHQTGPASANGDAGALLKSREGWPQHLRRRYVVREYIGEELADVYALADVVLGRAGAGTVSQLAVLGKPSILIPLVPTGGDEQTMNAKSLSDIGGAVLLAQRDATPARLESELESLLRDPAHRAALSVAALSAGKPDAAARLADELLRLADANAVRQDVASVHAQP